MIPKPVKPAPTETKVRPEISNIDAVLNKTKQNKIKIKFQLKFAK